MSESNGPISFLMTDILAIRARIELVERRLRSLLDAHEAARLAFNSKVTAQNFAEGPTNLPALSSFKVQKAIDTEPSATEAVLAVLVPLKAAGAPFEIIRDKAKQKASHLSDGSIRTALSRLMSKGVVMCDRTGGVVYRASTDAATRAGYRRRRRRPSATQRLQPHDVASPSDFGAAAAFQLILDGPMQGPELLAKLCTRLKASGKLAKYVGSYLGHHPGFENHPEIGYWLAGVPLPGKEVAILKARTRGTRSEPRARDGTSSKRSGPARPKPGA